MNHIKEENEWIVENFYFLIKKIIVLSFLFWYPKYHEINDKEHICKEQRKQMIPKYIFLNKDKQNHSAGNQSTYLF